MISKQLLTHLRKRLRSYLRKHLRFYVLAGMLESI